MVVVSEAMQGQPGTHGLVGAGTCAGQLSPAKQVHMKGHDAACVSVFRSLAYAIHIWCVQTTGGNNQTLVSRLAVTMESWSKTCFYCKEGSHSIASAEHGQAAATCVKCRMRESCGERDALHVPLTHDEPLPHCNAGQAASGLKHGLPIGAIVGLAQATLQTTDKLTAAGSNSKMKQDIDWHELI